jgi:arylamine N-acetyltransferase
LSWDCRFWVVSYDDGVVADVTAEVDLSAYFARIGYTGGTDPTLATLSGLVAGHNRSIPYETLDPLLGIPVADLGPAALTDKLVRRRRGGFCFEHSGLMQHVLTHMGFGVDALACRVVWMNPGGPLPAPTHVALAVTMPDVDGAYLVDVGFGGQTLSSPIQLVAGPVQTTRHEPYRIRNHADGFVLETYIRGTWQALYTFTSRPQPMIDLEVCSWYASTHPKSPFVTGLSAALVIDDARRNLRGRRLAIRGRDGSTEKIWFDTAGEVLIALNRLFGIDLTGLAGAEARVQTVLDNDQAAFFSA